MHYCQYAQQIVVKQPFFFIFRTTFYFSSPHLQEKSVLKASLLFTPLPHKFTMNYKE